ncbi:MAG: 2-dehydropantoate 2-reductase, partial [Candidatus Puniceispirillum sp.]
MKICIFGAGAIGGYLGAKLAAHGTDVSLVARGAHLDAMRTNGLRLIEETGETNVSVTASSDPQDLGEQDYLLITLKAHSVPPMVEKMAPLIGKHTTILSCVNGVPWWYFYKFGGDLEGTQLESVDPAGAQWNGFGPEKVLGCVVYPAAEVVEPGVIKHIEGNRFSLGEPDGQKSDRIVTLSGIFTEAGLKAPVRPRIRDEIWVKLWGNLSFNPISALTHATLDILCTDPSTKTVARNMMLEAQEIAEKLG